MREKEYRSPRERSALAVTEETTVVPDAAYVPGADDTAAQRPYFTTQGHEGDRAPRIDAVPIDDDRD